MISNAVYSFGKINIKIYIKITGKFFPYQDNKNPREAPKIITKVIITEVQNIRHVLWRRDTDLYVPRTTVILQPSSLLQK